MKHQSMQKPKVKAKQEGFSLTELMIVVGILGIMITVMVIMLGRNKDEEKLKLASSSILQYLKSAQIRSQQELAPCRVVVDHENLLLSIDNDQNILNNQDECTNIAPIQLQQTITGLSLEDLKICGTSQTSNTSIACDENNDGSDQDSSGQPKTQTTITFTPRGTVSEGGLLKLYSEQVKRTRCIAITTPIGLIREGQIRNNDCNFNTF